MDFPIINALSYKSTRGKSPCTDTSTREKTIAQKMMVCTNNSNLGNQAYFYPLLSPSRTRACVEKVKDYP